MKQVKRVFEIKQLQVNYCFIYIFLQNTWNQLPWESTQNFLTLQKSWRDLSMTLTNMPKSN